MSHEQFEKIAEKACRDAANVECSVGEYIEGLEVIIERLTEDKRAARIEAL
jgi:hypothetical protein